MGLSKFVNASAIFTVVCLILIGLAVCLFLYYYLHAKELDTWKSHLTDVCQERQRSFSYFVTFSMNTLQETSAFGAVVQKTQASGITPPSQNDWALFNEFSPSQGWFDSIILAPKVPKADRALWESQVGYPITFHNTTKLPYTLLPYPHTNEPDNFCQAQTKKATKAKEYR
jgi:hypothetical protein